MESLPTSDQKQWNIGCDSREKLYKEWRIKIKGMGYAQDIDTIEYNYKKGDDGKPNLICIIELSLVQDKDGIHFPENYLKTVDKNRAQQMGFTRYLGQRLEIPAFYLMFERKFDRFFVKNLTDGNGEWWICTPKQWETYLRKLHKGEITHKPKKIPKTDLSDDDMKQLEGLG